MLFATGLCGALAAALLALTWAGNQDSISVYRLDIAERGHLSPSTVSEAMEAVAHCRVEASIAPRLATVTLRVDVCGQLQFYYFRQQAQHFA